MESQQKIHLYFPPLSVASHELGLENGAFLIRQYAGALFHYLPCKAMSDGYYPWDPMTYCRVHLGNAIDYRDVRE